MPSIAARLRSLWWTVHRWIGVAFLVLLMPISLSGALLVWHDHLDAVINPSRYAVSGPQVAQPAAVYLARATEALPAGVTVSALRFPEEPGWPVTVMGRGAPLAEGAPVQFKRVYLDPPTGRVLDLLDARTSFIGFLHRFHENLTIPQWSGRPIVGWLGTGMLILCLTGLWLWWPRNGAFLIGLRWRRAASSMTNVHFMLGFWIALPLAVVSFTGMYLSFPQTARSALSAIAPMNPQGTRPGFGGEILRETARNADNALAKALESESGAKPAAIFLPTTPARRPDVARAAGAHAEPARNETGRGEAGRGEAGRGQGPSPAWRIQLRKPDDQIVTIMVDDRAGTARRAPDPLAGDRVAQWMRWIHEGSHSGPVWQLLVFLTGIFPLVLSITGLVMWLRGRRDRKTVRAARGGVLASETV